MFYFSKKSEVIFVLFFDKSDYDHCYFSADSKTRTRESWVSTNNFKSLATKRQEFQIFIQKFPNFRSNFV